MEHSFVQLQGCSYRSTMRQKLPDQNTAERKAATRGFHHLASMFNVGNVPCDAQDNLVEEDAATYVEDSPAEILDLFDPQLRCFYVHTAFL